MSEWKSRSDERGTKAYYSLMGHIFSRILKSGIFYPIGELDVMG
jgi:hypothetical protein